jgi:hypothetical protein
MVVDGLDEDEASLPGDGFKGTAIPFQVCFAAGIFLPALDDDIGVTQLRETFPEAGPYRYVILDHDAKFDADVIGFLEATGLKTKRTSVRAPWQNGAAERWVGSCRREIPRPCHRIE